VEIKLTSVEMYIGKKLKTFELLNLQIIELLSSFRISYLFCISFCASLYFI